MNEQVRYLTEEVGLDLDDARRRLQDSELWLIRPETRLGLADEEAVEEWGRAVADLDAAAELFGSYSPATVQAILEGQERAAEAQRRARSRLEG